VVGSAVDVVVVAVVVVVVVVLAALVAVVGLLPGRLDVVVVGGDAVSLAACATSASPAAMSCW
jgi:hypothetical protein